MNIKALFTDDKAVSPVIGVILMVAITVILAAVIGTFVLNIGGSMGTTAPQASYGWSQDGSSVTVTHEGGDAIDPSSLGIAFNPVGNSDIAEDDNPTWVTDEWASGDKVSAGDSVTFEQTNGTDVDFESGDEFRILWESEDGGSSSVLTKFTVN